MKAFIKDFVDDIKNAFNVLPEYLMYGFIISILMALISGIELGLSVFICLVAIWTTIFILFPAVNLVLSILNHGSKKR